MAAVTVVMASFFATIIIATQQLVGVSSPGDVVLILVAGDAGNSLNGSLGGLTAPCVRVHMQVPQQSVVGLPLM